MLKGFGEGGSAASQVTKIREIKQWVRESLSLSAETTVMVAELACTEPGCPPLETVVALLHGPGDSTQGKIHRSIVDVTREDILTLCSQFASGSDAETPQ
jgi:hypothetical protein